MISRLRRPAPVLAALLGAFLLLAPTAPRAAAADPVESAARKEITPARALTAVRILAGPAFQGRGTGQKGNEEAAKWLAGELRKAGLAPGPVPDTVVDGKKKEGDYLQWFTAESARGPKGGGPRTANVIGILRGTGHRAGGTVTPASGAGPGAGGDGDGAPGGTDPGSGGEEGDPGGEALAASPAAAGTWGETVVLGAHFDHLGIPKYDPAARKPPKKSSVYWGADDNASGTTAALLVARTLGRLAGEGVLPRRTIVLAFFTAEEAGLLGSKHYVSAPVVPLADTVAMINLDMVGRNATRTMEVYGNTSSPELDAWHRRALEETKLDCSYPSPALLTRSDQWPFYEAKVPVVFFHGGLHNDYHTPRDVVEELNFPKIALIARHAFEVLWMAANEEDRPSFREVDMSGAGGRLGIAVDPCTPEEVERLELEEGRGAVRVVTVFAGGLGEKLFEPGDLIFSWNGFPLFADDPLARMTSFIDAARQGDTVVVRFLRGKDRKAASVKF